MDGKILFLFLKFSFEEFYKNSGFEIHYNKGCREIYLFILKYDDSKEKINVLEHGELIAERKNQFRYIQYMNSNR